MAKSKKPTMRRTLFENIDSEIADREHSPPTYNILTYPADFTLEVLVKKIHKKEIVIPKFQRSYVWKPSQASKLIESFLLGLPVPPIYFFVEEKTGKLLVVDGQQRLKTTRYFFDGKFAKDNKGQRPIFALSGLDEDSKFSDLTFTQLAEKFPADYENLRNTTLRSIIIKQLKPDGDSSIFHIFERLNTGGTPLQGQEIRNCLYHGEFSKLLSDLNKLSSWRKILNKKQPDKRQRDVELILRFLALFYNASAYTKPMKSFLTDFMRDRKNMSTENQDEYEELFTTTSADVLKHLGNKPFNIRSGLNAAVYDSVFVAFASNKSGIIPPDIRERYSKLLEDDDYKVAIVSGTTDVEIIRKRIKLAKKFLFGD